MIDLVIFDIDGTLIDSKENHVFAWKKAFTKIGYDIPIKEIQRQFGRRKKETIERFLPEEKWSTDGQQIIELKRQFFWQNFQTIKVFPGTFELIDHLKKNQIKISLATSAKLDELELYYQVLPIKDKVDYSINADDISKSKPDPEAVFKILKALMIKPENASMVGDSIHDIKSGNLAGLTTIGVLTGYTNREQFEQNNADYIFTDIMSLYQEIDEILLRGT